MFDFDKHLTDADRADRALHRRSDAGRVRLWRGVAHFAGSADAGDRGQAHRGDDRRRRQCGAQSGRARHALHFRRRGRRRRCRPRAERGVDHPSADRIPSGGRCGAADHAQGPLRVGAPLHPYVARRLGNGLGRRRGERGRADRPRHQGDAARGRGGAVGLRQGRADAARHPRRHRRRQQTRQAGGGRSERPRLQHLSRRHRDHAEPAGTRRRDPLAGANRRSGRGGGGRTWPRARERKRFW